MQQGVKLGAETRAHGGREADQLVRELVERVAQTVAQARPWKQGPHTAGRAVKTIGESTFHLIRRVFLIGDALKLAIRSGERSSAFGRTVPQMPDHSTTEDRGQVDPLGETAAVFLIGQDI